MKIAITTAENNGLSGKMDGRFGRAFGFIVADEETGNHTFASNEQNIMAAQGAGVQAAQSIAAQGVSVVITGHCGPKAHQLLIEAGIDIYSSTAATVEEALEAFRRGDLSKSNSPDVAGHWS